MTILSDQSLHFKRPNFIKLKGLRRMKSPDTLAFQSSSSFSNAEPLSNDSAVNMLTSDQQLVQNRYFLHNHPADHLKYQNRINLFGEYLQRLRHHRRTQVKKQFWQLNSTRNLDDMSRLRLVKSGVDMTGIVYENGHGSQRDANKLLHEIHSIQGHSMVPATCSRYYGRCESCRQTVHATKYLYCQNCPSVCHKSKHCMFELLRPCPSRDLQLDGWGEGIFSTDYRLQSELDLEFIYLGHLKSSQANQCADCGRVLERSLGHLCTGDTQTSKKRHLKGFRKVFRRKKKLPPDCLVEQAKHVSLCHYTGRYYCERCHWSDEWYIPGCIFVLNDCQKHPVSRAAYLKLRVLWDTAVIKVPSYWHLDNDEAGRVYNIRRKLQHMSRYFLACKEAMDIKDILNDSRAPHLLGQPKFLRMVDVISIVNRTLYPQLERKFNLINSHIRKCGRCRMMNRPCCKCNRGRLLYAYDDGVEICSSCNGTYHVQCSNLTGNCGGIRWEKARQLE